MKNPFRTIKKLDPEELINQAFKSASASIKKEKFTGKYIERAKQKEGMRIKIVGSVICSNLKSIAKSYPNLSKLPEFYSELIEVIIGKKRLSKIISSTVWTANRIKKLQMRYLDKLNRVNSTKDARRMRREFYGRVSSFLKKVKKDFSILNESYKILKGFPDVEGIKVIIIAGFPNVGKSSLLWELTGSKPKIRSYPFTTKGLMVGYSMFGFKKVQFFDTPGLLDRPLNRRNKIEMQAIIVLKILADAIIYIFDISETCGYSIKEQLKLYNDIKKTFKKPIVAVANKIDIAEKKNIGIKGLVPVSCEKHTGIEKLNKKIKDIISRG